MHPALGAFHSCGYRGTVTDRQQRYLARMKHSVRWPRQKSQRSSAAVGIAATSFDVIVERCGSMHLDPGCALGARMRSWLRISYPHPHAS